VSQFDPIPKIHTWVFHSDDYEGHTKELHTVIGGPLLGRQAFLLFWFAAKRRAIGWTGGDQPLGLRQHAFWIFSLNK
jgi:hypothetical protein